MKQPYTIQTRGSALGAVLGVGAAVILALLSGYGVYVWRQRTITDQEATIASLTVQLRAAQAHQTDQQPGTQYTSAKGTKVIVYAPTAHAKITNPMAVVGEVPGSWSFEASFPVELKDSQGVVVASGTGHVLGEWTTSALVPFSASLTYTTTPSGSGMLVLHKDNPSDLPQNADQVAIPIEF